MKRVVIKLSSGLLISNQEVQYEWLDELGRLVASLQKDNYQVWLVTSGAVALTRHYGNDPFNKHDITKGQSKLFNLYKKAFSKSGVDVAEVLIAKEDFEHRKRYLEIRDNFNNLAQQQVIALINDLENVEDLALRQFSDNDEIAGLVASLVDAHKVILASTVSGVLRPDGTVVSEMLYGDKSWASYVTKKTSEHGKGGMEFKCIAAEHNAQRGLETIICDGSILENVKKAVTGKQIGTKFISDKRIAARKRWILDKKDFTNGVIQVDDGLARVIEDGKSASLLTVGIESIEGKFLVNDIITIRHRKKILGYGEATLDAETAREAITNKISKLLVHYDKYARIRG